jgi:zinc protease
MRARLLHVRQECSPLRGRRRWSACFALLSSLCLVWPSAGVAGEVIAYSLPNGLRVALQEDHSIPRVAVHVSYGVGWRDAPAGHRGLPHLYEHLMFGGSRHAPGDAFWHELTVAGATDVNGTTTADTTEFGEVVPADEVARALWLESDRLAFLVDQLSPQRVEIQKKALLAELDSTQQGVSVLLDRLVREAIFATGHPYRDAEDQPGDLRATTPADAQWFGQAWYRPDNAILSLAGDFDPAEVRALINRYFESIVAAPDRAVRVASPHASLPTEDRFDVDARQRTGAVRIVWPTPPALSADDAVLDVIARLLVDQGHGRLEWALQQGRPSVQRVAVTRECRELGSLFQLDAEGDPREKPEDLLETIDEELDRLRRSDVPAKELARVLGELTSEERVMTRPLPARAAWMARFWRAWGDPDAFQRHADRYVPITNAEIHRVVRSDLPADRRVVVIVHENDAAAAGGKLVDRRRMVPGAE